MDIHREGDFRVGSDLGGRLLFGIESKRVAQCVAEAKRRRAWGVFGTPGFGFRQDNLDFLASLPKVGSVWFWDVALRNIDGLYALKHLESFGVHPKRPPVDFARLPTLREVVWFYGERDTGLAGLPAIRMLHVWHYGPKSRSFDGLALPAGVEELELVWGNPSSLQGLPTFPRLKKLVIRRYRNLESIAELPRIAPNVEHLVVTNCARVADGPSVVRELPAMRHAFVRDKVLVTRTP